MFPLTVLEKSARGEIAAFDIYSRLLKDRIVFLGEEITDNVATCVIAQLLHLSFASKKEDIHFYIMSPGGSVSAGLAIYDTMQYIPQDVATYCLGEASSMGAFLLASGAKNKRYALPSARIMIHQPWTALPALDAKSLEIEAKEMSRIKDLVYERLSLHTGKPKRQIEKDCDRDNYMSVDEARRYGIIDQVLRHAPYGR